MFGLSLKSRAKFLSGHFASQINQNINPMKTSHQNVIREAQQRKNAEYSLILKRYFSTNSIYSDETYVLTQDNSIPSSQSSQILTRKQFQPEKETYINYQKIYEQNKRRLKELQANSQLRRLLFDQNYIKTQLIDTRYFYADILAIFSHVIQQLSLSIKESCENPASSSLITPTHLHFILTIYHMYIKQFKGYKQQTYAIIQHFFHHYLFTENLRIQQNLQTLVYLRKFIDSEIFLGNGSKIAILTQKYCQFLQTSYQNQSTNLDNQLGQQSSKDTNLSAKIIKKSKTLENYLLSYPNLWVSTFNGYAQNQAQQLSELIISTYEFFVTQFSTLFRLTIDQWLNTDSSEKLPNQMPVNFSFRKSLLQEFKQQDLNKCFNCLRLVIHRLWSILETPKLFSQKTQQGAKKVHQQSLSQQKYMALGKKYEQGNLKVLGYLPSEKMEKDEVVKFMRLLILMKNLLGYHSLRRIRDKDLTSHLEELFQNNRQIIQTEKSDKKRQINILIGQLISRLVSGSWTDSEDVLGKYFEKNVVIHRENKGRRDFRGEWFDN